MTFHLTIAAATVVAAMAAQTPAPAPLQGLVGAERAFAARATEIGWRDAFLEFFADDAIALAPQPTPAKERLRKQPALPFTVAELTWEPRTGAIAASGELGWLTGPSTSINRAASDGKPRYGNYLSVWRRQAGGPWRVFIDVGINVPEPATFAPGFTAFPFESRYRGGGTRGEAATTLAEADNRLNSRLPGEGSAAAYRGALAPHARLHRTGHSPASGRDAAARWLEQHAPAMTATHGASDAAESADLGYTYGTYEVKKETTESGAYVRVWQRDSAGTWWIVADVTQPAPKR